MLLKRLYLLKWHDVLFNVRPTHRFRVFTVICDHYGDSRVVLPYAVNEIFEFVITKEGLGGYGDKGTDIVLLSGNNRTRDKHNKPIKLNFWHQIYKNCGSATGHKPPWDPEL